MSDATASYTTEPPIQPRFGAKAKITTEASVLLVKEQHADGSSFWTLPGGGLQSTEAPAAGLRREIAEELGCRVLIGEATGTFWYAYQSKRRTVSAYTVFECTLPSPTANATEGVCECRWVAPNKFPPQTLPQVSFLCR